MKFCSLADNQENRSIAHDRGRRLTAKKRPAALFSDRQKDSTRSNPSHDPSSFTCPRGRPNGSKYRGKLMSAPDIPMIVLRENFKASTGSGHGGGEQQGGPDGITESRRQEALLKTGALQDAILNSAYFSSIATDEKGVIQIFNAGAERMLGFAAVDVVNQVTPADISDPQELIARAASLSLELDTPITPGFEALVFKASRGIEDIYELTYIRKDGSRVPAIVSVTALRDGQKNIIGYLLIGTDNTARKQVEAVQALLDQRLRDSTGGCRRFSTRWWMASLPLMRMAMLKPLTRQARVFLAMRALK